MNSTNSIASTDPLGAFIEAACVPLDCGHASGTLDHAREILAAHPAVATQSIYAAAILGDAATVRRFIELDSASVTAKGGPRGWDALTHLCFSKYLRLDRARSDGFVDAASALLDAGASANTGWFETNHQPKPEWESVLYGAAGIAHHEAVTRLLLERGADPNDGEVAYHSPESWDNAALKAILESGKTNADTLATMLLRKADWHDFDGIKLLLEHGANPNRLTHWGFAALHQALRRDNDLENIEVMLDHGADPTLVNRVDGCSAITIAARRGRNDVLELFARGGTPLVLRGVEQLLAACARNDSKAIRSIVENEPHLVHEVLASGGQLLAEFAGNGNADGVCQLLDLGVGVNAAYVEGDGYFGTAPNSSALHVAAWRARPAVVQALIARGASVNLRDGHGRTPLALAVRACVDSYWTHRRTPESVAMLLRAGASAGDVTVPTGYAEVDELLRTNRQSGA